MICTHGLMRHVSRHQRLMLTHNLWIDVQRHTVERQHRSKECWTTEDHARIPINVNRRYARMESVMAYTRDKLVTTTRTATLNCSVRRAQNGHGLVSAVIWDVHTRLAMRLMSVLPQLSVGMLHQVMLVKTPKAVSHYTARVSELHLDGKKSA